MIHDPELRPGEAERRIVVLPERSQSSHLSAYMRSALRELGNPTGRESCPYRRPS